VQEAVGISRSLALADPAHRRDYAKALNNLSNRLSDFGRHEKALGAIVTSEEIRCHLANESLRDAFANHETMLNLLSELSRPDEPQALTALKSTCQDLAARRPDTHLPDLAMVLANMAVELGALG
jgi:hypothetical protein